MKNKPQSLCNQTILITNLLLVSIALPSLPSFAQTTNPPQQQLDQQTIVNLNRAKNLARQAAEKANGGLAVYRAEPAMHKAASETNYTDNGDSWTFTFLGGRPGATPSIESVVTVNKSDLSVKIDYNGAIQTVGTSGNTSVSNNGPSNEQNPDDIEFSSPSVLVDLNRAKNLARQAAEKENGGVTVYRAEPAMHGAASETTYTDNGNSWTFTFLGGTPGMNPTIQSVVTVGKDGSVKIDYNGPIR